MTKANPPIGDRRFARDVAKQLDRRRMRRKLATGSGLVALVAAAAMYLTCGGGFGLGGPGKGPGEAGPPDRTEGPRRCAIRVTASGITVGGKPMQRDDAVAACKATAGADVVVTGDARQGDWDDLRGALDTADVPIFKRDQPPGSAGSH